MKKVDPGAVWSFVGTWLEWIVICQNRDGREYLMICFFLVHDLLSKKKMPLEQDGLKDLV